MPRHDAEDCCKQNITMISTFASPSELLSVGVPKDFFDPGFDGLDPDDYIDSPEFRRARAAGLM
jgi:hypothetical protein